MFNVFTVITAIVMYMVGLFLIARLVERKSLEGVNFADNPVVYSLSLAVYCTTWTYYGSIGKAASSGMMFLTIYLGPTLTFILGWMVLRKLARIKAAQRITSIADFISARYNRSQGLAAIATVAALMGVAPYIALQLKAIISTFKIVTTTEGFAAAWIGNHVGFMVVVLMIIFTCAFGVRRLDPTERHPGMVIVVAVESLVKLVAFLTAGIFVTYFMYDGFGDIFKRVADSNLMVFSARQSSYYITWTSYTILAMSAIMFLPRQFHVAVVENSDDKHIRTAMWLFPLYMFLINLFVFPIAMGGLLQGYAVKQADTFLLSLPMASGKVWLSMFVFIGGFSAGTAMIMICSMTLSTMATNHLLLPLVDWVKWLGFLRRHLLKCRWVAVAAVVAMGYEFEKTLGGSYMLVNMGMISFAAVLQFAPVIIGGIFWQRANKAGALLGLTGGFMVWFYTLLLPAFLKSGWLSKTLLEHGPWGIGLLRPEHLLGLTALDPISHTVFWSMLFNIGLYVWGSLYFEQSREEQGLAIEFVDVLGRSSSMARFFRKESKVNFPAKRGLVKGLLGQYFSEDKADALVERTIQKVGLSGKSKASLSELAEFYAAVEKNLAGAIGAAAAHRAITKEELFTPQEAEELSAVYAEILASLNLTPEELKTKIDYYQEKEQLLTSHAMQLEEKIKEREAEIVLRKQAENEVRILNEELDQRVIQRTAELNAANKELEAFSYSVSHDLRAPLRSIDGFSLALLEDYKDKIDDEGQNYLQRVRTASQRMAELIDHILKLSRLVRVEIHREKVNLSELARSIAEDLQISQPERHVDFVIADEVVADGDAVLLRMVMDNLLGNAWKYTSKNASARIEFGVLNHRKVPTYFVRDDGTGFDMVYANKLFGMFQRLHAADEFEGLGIGLATVQRILHRLGGRIWAEGAIDHGATFYFNLQQETAAREKAVH